MRCLIFLILGSCLAGRVIDTSKQKLFGHSIKNGHLVANEEIPLFEHNCTIQPCTITQMHCPTAGPTGWESAVVRIYIDGEATASIQLTLLELANVGKFNANGNERNNIPWGESLFGHTAANGGVYSTVRVPFLKTIRLTLTSSQHGTFWFIVRGVESYPVVLGDLILPNEARLQIIKNSSKLDPQQFVSLANIPSGFAGALLSVKLDSAATSYTYLEACMRAYIDGSDLPLFLSSGAEDYFLSAFYFNENLFKTPESGLTFFDGKGTLSAYKVHDRDPVFFNNGFQLVWRNCETTTGCGDTQHCPNQWCPPGSEAIDFPSEPAAPKAPEVVAEYDTAVWLYTWPTPAEVSACPGGNDLTACMQLCPSSPPRAFKACVSICADRC